MTIPLPCVIQERCVACTLILSAACKHARGASRLNDSSRRGLTAKLSWVHALPPIDRPIWTIAESDTCAERAGEVVV